jgi:hypothetical protein
MTLLRLARQAFAFVEQQGRLLRRTLALLRLRNRRDGFGAAAGFYDFLGRSHPSV